jgi:hypothetical protein
MVAVRLARWQVPRLAVAIATDPWQLRARARLCGGLELWILRGCCVFFKTSTYLPSRYLQFGGVARIVT